ncbi:MAG: hypothetical protein HZA92_11460 [Verrucomicrobia bacterium]|nr:hypothetical protein [Verrucomicrobiota bacterium]
MTRNLFPSLKTPSALAALASAGLLLTGCQKEEIAVYRVPKVPPGAGSTTEPGTPHAASHGAPRPHAHWESLPPGWSEQPAAGSRAATFAIEGKAGQHAEAAVIAFPGMGGTDLQFVNLWREQLGLGPLTDEELPKLVQPAIISGADGKLYDITAATTAGAEKPGDRIIVALHKQDGVSWFIKLTGSAALVDQQKPAFLGFLKTLKFHAGADEGEPSTASAPRPAAPVASSAGTPAWTAPAHWKQQAPGSMQAAKYTVGEGKAKAEVTAVFLGGMGGALKANLDRWRAQLTLPASAESEVEKLAPPFPALGSGARIVELSGSTGEGDTADMIVLLVPAGRGTWFYKLMGDKSVVAKEKDALIAFVKSAKP